MKLLGIIAATMLAAACHRQTAAYQEQPEPGDPEPPNRSFAPGNINDHWALMVVREGQTRSMGYVETQADCEQLLKKVLRQDPAITRAKCYPL